MVSGSRRVGRLKARNKVQSDAKASAATRAVGYLRVSTDEQATTGHGLETQEKAVRAFAESQAYDLVEVVTDPASREQPALPTGPASGMRSSWPPPAASTCCWSPRSTGSRATSATP